VIYNETTNNEPFKFKGIAKRTSQLSFIALIVSIGIAVYYFALGLTVSSVMVGCFSLAVLIILLMQLVNIVKNVQPLMVTSICILLIVSSFDEGSSTGQYFYFFPVIVVIPIVVNYKESSYIELGAYFLLGLASFFINFYVGHSVKPIENIPPDVSRRMLFTNASCAILITFWFALAYIYYERKYIVALVAEKNRAIAERTKFLSTMGHELRTPLNGIIGAVNIFTDDHPEYTTNEYFQILKYCSNHMQQLVNDILDFNKIEAGKLNIHPIEINLKELLINSTLPFYNNIEQKNLQLKVEIDPKLDAIIMADDVRIIQVINNLLSNALKFTDVGYIRLKVTCESATESALKVNFIVEDTGIGIDKADQERIFDGFEQVYSENTRKYAGTGLGLNICLRLLNLMNGSLTLTSEKGKGSIFAFTLTFDRAEKSANKIVRSYNESEGLAGLKILIVEDNQINMTIARKMLTGYKATCTPAYNGKEALDILKKNADFNIVLLDLEMPVMNGHEAIIQLKKLYPTIPVIAFTASLIDAEMMEILVKEGFVDCISKPFHPKQLLSQVKNYALQLPAVTRPDPSVLL